MSALAMLSCKGDSPASSDWRSLAIVRNPDSVWVFALDASAEPRERHRLEYKAARELIAIITDRSHYDNASVISCIIGRPEYGFEFRKKDAVFDLYCMNDFSYFWSTNAREVPLNLSFLSNDYAQRAREWEQKYLLKLGFVADESD